MFAKTAMVAVTTVLLLGSAFANDPIEGNWLTQYGQTAAIAPCGGGFYCVTLKTGKYAGSQIGSLKNMGTQYEGKVTDPARQKTYSGKATITGDVMKMSGCVLGGLICRARVWNRKP